MTQLFEEAWFQNPAVYLQGFETLPHEGWATWQPALLQALVDDDGVITPFWAARIRGFPPGTSPRA